jgi:hypothetical protein
MLIHFIHGYYCIYRPWQPLAYLYFPYCISLIYFSFTKIRMFLYARIYWLAEFGDVSCLQFNYLRVETLTPTWEDFVGRFCRTILRATLSSSPTKLCVRPESMIVDTLGGICTIFRKAPPSIVSGYGERSINLNKVVATLNCKQETSPNSATE